MIEVLLSWLVFIVAVMGLILWAVCGFRRTPKRQPVDNFEVECNDGLAKHRVETAESAVPVTKAAESLKFSAMCKLVGRCSLRQGKR